MSVYVRGWAWCVRIRAWDVDEVSVFRYATKPRKGNCWFKQDSPGGIVDEGSIELCPQGFYAATGLGPSDLPLDTPVKVRFGNAEVID